MRFQFADDTSKRGYNKADLELALKEKLDNETLFNTLIRLERQGKVGTPNQLPEQKRLVNARAIKGILKARDIRVGEGTIEEIERAVTIIIDIAAKMAKLCGRKTLKPEDVTGKSLNWRA